MRHGRGGMADGMREVVTNIGGKLVRMGICRDEAPGAKLGY